jgi:hypothetical protein
VGLPLAEKPCRSRASASRIGTCPTTPTGPSTTERATTPAARPGPSPRRRRPRPRLVRFVPARGGWQVVGSASCARGVLRLTPHVVFPITSGLAAAGLGAGMPPSASPFGGLAAPNPYAAPEVAGAGLPMGLPPQVGRKHLSNIYPEEALLRLRGAGALTHALPPSKPTSSAAMARHHPRMSAPPPVRPPSAPPRSFLAARWAPRHRDPPALPSAPQPRPSGSSPFAAMQGAGAAGPPPPGPGEAALLAGPSHMQGVAAGRRRVQPPASHLAWVGASCAALRVLVPYLRHTLTTHTFAARLTPSRRELRRLGRQRGGALALCGGGRGGRPDHSRLQGHTRPYPAMQPRCTII